MNLEVDSLNFEVGQEKTKMSRKKERSPELEEFDDLACHNAYHLLVHGRPTFHGGLPYVAVVWQVNARHHLL